MPTGPGSFDANGIWLYGEDDTESLASDLLNIGQDSVSDQLTIDRGRLTALEGSAPFRLIGRAVRAANAPTFGAASFTDLSANANWSTAATAGQVKGFAAYSNGWIVPESGVYDVGWALIADVAFLAGITVNKSAAVADTDLRCAASAVSIQSRPSVTAREPIRLAAGDVIRLFAISTAGTATLRASQGSFSLTWVGGD